MVSIDIWTAVTSVTTELWIRNCTTLRVNLLCSTSKKVLELLRISDVKELIITPTRDTLNPPTVRIENVGNIEVIPQYTFAQFTVYKRQGNRNNCPVLQKDLRSVWLSNIKRIGTIESHAFEDLKDMAQLHFDNVHVGTVETKAIRVELADEGSFEIANGSFHTVEPRAIHVNGMKGAFEGNVIGNLSSYGICGILQQLRFSGNNVTYAEENAYDVLGYDIEIAQNVFKHLRGRTFAKVGPGLLSNARRNFAKISFTYNFTNNIIHELEHSSLIPDDVSYKNVAAKIIFNDNLINCSSRALSAWLDSHKRDLDAMNEFLYGNLTNSRERNFCMGAVQENQTNSTNVSFEEFLNYSDGLINVTRLTVELFDNKYDVIEIGSSGAAVISAIWSVIVNVFMLRYVLM